MCLSLDTFNTIATIRETRLLNFSWATRWKCNSLILRHQNILWSFCLPSFGESFHQDTSDMSPTKHIKVKIITYCQTSVKFHLMTELNSRLNDIVHQWHFWNSQSLPHSQTAGNLACKKIFGCPSSYGSSFSIHPYLFWSGNNTQIITFNYLILYALIKYIRAAYRINFCISDCHWCIFLHKEKNSN